MKKLFFIPIFCLLLSATACQTPDNGENDAPEELVEKSMEQLIEDLQNGLFIAGYYEVYDGDVCIKKSDEYIGDSMGAKFGDMGLDHRIAFYNDGTCRYGYSNSFVGGCTKGDSSHPKLLYDTWQWSYDIDAKTIPIPPIIITAFKTANSISDIFFPPHFTSTAPNLQTSLHCPHLMHFSLSITCCPFTTPVIAPTGHFLEQRVQPLHLSAMIS